MFNSNLRSAMDESETRRCGARLRQGGTCPLPPANGKRRCFQHGGARGIGPPKDSRNARKHGFFSREAIAERRRINGFIRECLRTLREYDAMTERERPDESRAPGGGDGGREIPDRERIR